MYWYSDFCDWWSGQFSHVAMECWEKWDESVNKAGPCILNSTARQKLQFSARWRWLRLRWIGPWHLFRTNSSNFGHFSTVKCNQGMIRQNFITLQTTKCNRKECTIFLLRRPFVAKFNFLVWYASNVSLLLQVRKCFGESVLSFTDQKLALTKIIWARICCFENSQNVFQTTYSERPRTGEAWVYMYTQSDTFQCKCNCNCKIQFSTTYSQSTKRLDEGHQVRLGLVWLGYELHIYVHKVSFKKYLMESADTMYVQYVEKRKSWSNSANGKFDAKPFYRIGFKLIIRD
jgi:hypothetical protein